MHIADRIKNLPAYPFAKLGRRIRELTAQGADVIRLDIGSPDLPPPDFVVQALYRSAQDPSHHGYGGYFGIPQLRQAIATYYERRFGVHLDAEREVVPLIGSKEGISNVALAFLNPGDLVLCPDPGYPAYTLGTLIAGGQPYRLPLLAENGYLPNLEAIPTEIAHRARILWLNYPNNPSGAVAPLAFFEQAVAFAQEYDVLLCHDNPYCDVTFDGYRAPSVLQVPGASDVALEFNSLSKTYNMAGWRVGMAVGNATAVEALARLKTNIDSGIFRAIQDAAIQALTGDQTWLAARNETYRQRRDLILDTLQRVGMTASKSTASLYVWAAIPPDYDSDAFCTRLLEEAHVSITPGTFFGSQGEGYVRISVAMATERIAEALARLRALEL